VELLPTAYRRQYIYQALFVSAEMGVVAHVFGAVDFPPGHQAACLRRRMIE
jgi:hypothetical protein